MYFNSQQTGKKHHDVKPVFYFLFYNGAIHRVYNLIRKALLSTTRHKKTTVTVRHLVSFSCSCKNLRTILFTIRVQVLFALNLGLCQNKLVIWPPIVVTLRGKLPVTAWTQSAVSHATNRPLL